MKKNILALFVVLSAMFNFTFAQDPVVVNFSNESGDNGSTVTVDVTCEDFIDITGMQLYIGWDESVLEFNNITNINSELDGFNGSSFATPGSTPVPLPEGHVNISWFTTNIFGESETLPDGTILFSIVLDVVGQPCDESLFELVDYNGQPNEAYDGNFNELPVIFNAGTVEVPGTDCGGSGGDGNGLGLIAETIIAEAGSNVCVEITVDSFVNINSGQFAIQYDETVLEYTGYLDGPLTDELINPTGANHVRFLWLVPADEDPSSIPDGDAIIEFCFNVIGDLGDCSPIEVISITQPPALEIEFIDEFGSVVEYYTEVGEVCVGTPPDNPVTFIASDEVGDVGSNVCIDITTENFEDIGGFQWAFSWNSNVMTYSGLGSVNNIGINPTDVVSQNDGLLRVSWFPTTGVTEEDGTILFQLCFDMVGDCGDESTASFVNDGSDFQIEVGDSDGNPLPHAVQNGSVSIECACSITHTVTDVKCNGDEDGKIYITLNGCSAQSYNWSNGAVSQNLLGVGAGSYQVTVTDTNGGEIVSQWITVNEPAPIIISGAVTDKSCGNDGGTIQLTVSGGTPGYSYSWNPNVSTGPNAINLNPGVYTVTVTDNNDCPESKSFTVSSTVTALVVSGTKKDVVCKGANDGEISINASGACTPYNISWSDGAGAGLFNRTDMAPGTYTATVTDDSGSGETISFTISEPAEALVISFESVTNAIVDGADGLIDIEIEGGEEPYTINWSNGANTEDITAPAGTYTVFIEDARGCAIEKTFTIAEEYDKVTLTAEQASDLYNGYGVSCFGECDGKINMSVTGNAPFTLFVNGAEVPFEDFPQENFCAGDYTLRILDAKGLDATVTVTVDEPEQLTVVEDEIQCSMDDDGSISIIVSGGTGDYEYNWGDPSLDGDFIENLVEGTYGVYVSDENDCQVQLLDLVVEECEKGECFIATPIITPNNDGFNDYFEISCLRDIPDNQLDVFDRWGREVFSQGDYDGSWQGNGNDGQLDEGSYMWVLTAYLGNGDERIYKGTVTILR